MPELELAGCAPAPLASYLKALGVLRLAAHQADPAARGYWRDDVFVLRSALDAEGLAGFFLDRYRPTPVVSPWNAGSGFHPKDYRAALEQIERDASPRLEAYRDAIAAARGALSATAGLPSKEAKVAVASRCRAALPDEALEWLDAALVLTGEGLGFPPLLVSGGNDGRLDFSNNFMQRLVDVLPDLGQAGRELSAAWLRAALYAEPSPALREAAVGMFNPGGAGGANAVAGFEGVSLVNPWNFVLMIEGALLFAGAAARRLAEGEARASYPFTVEPSSAGVLHGASPSERVRAEIWLPLWRAPSSLAEVEHLCAEGRAEWQRRQARDAVEFAGAVASLGVARGIDSFVRYAIYQRMGNNHVATQVRRIFVPAERRREVDLLAGVDWWLRRFRDRVGRDAPSALQDVKAQLERAVFDLCLHGGTEATQAVLVQLGRAELAFAGREALAQLYTPLILRREWLWACRDDSAEFRLAAALGSVGAGTQMPIRTNLEPVELQRDRLVRRPTRSQAWGSGSPVRDLAALLQRRLLDAAMADEPPAALAMARPAPLRDVDALLRGHVDLHRMAGLMVGLSLVRWGRPPADEHPMLSEVPPSLPRAYALLKLCFLPFDFDLGGQQRSIPVEPGILAALAAGRIEDAVRRAALRLRGSGVPLHRAAHAEAAALAEGLDAARLLVALLVPISSGAARRLAALISITDQSEVPA